MRTSNASTSVKSESAVASTQSVNERRFAMLKRSGIFSGDLKGCTIERACSAADLASAYRLVHDVFVASGFLNPEPTGIRLRMYEALSDTATFIAKHRGTVVGVLSVVGDSPSLGLPSDSAFKNELDELRATGLRLFEISNQAVAEEYRRSAVATELMRCAIAHALHAGYDRGVATVSPSHRGFYSMIGFEEIGSERSYSDELYDPVIALSMNLDSYREASKGDDPLVNFIHHELTAGNKFRSQILTWCREARKAFLNQEFLRRLFVLDSNFLAECSLAHRAILQVQWGVSLLMDVTGSTPAMAPVGRGTLEVLSSNPPFSRISAPVFSDETAERKTCGNPPVSTRRSLTTPWRNSRRLLRNSRSQKTYLVNLYDGSKPELVRP